MTISSFKGNVLYFNHTKNQQKTQHMITRKDIIHPNKLRILAKVIELNSVTQAAKSLSITQPAVSHALHSLENHFSTTLIKKSGNAITITPAAKIL